MARGPCTFRQQDVTRALKAAEAAGLKIARVEIDRAGKIVIVPGEAKPADVDEELDRELSEHRQRNGYG